MESIDRAPVYMFGYEVPRNHSQAMELDRKNGNTKWADSERLERDQLLGITIRSLTRATSPLPPSHRDTRRSPFTLSTQSSMTADTRAGQLQEDT